MSSCFVRWIFAGLCSLMILVWIFSGWIWETFLIPSEQPHPKISISGSAILPYRAPPQFILGDPDAKRELIVYSALTCRACKVFHETTLKPYLEHNSGFRVIIRHYPLDRKALPAAVAVACMPNHARAFYEAIFLQQEAFIEADSGEDFLDQLAVRQFGLKSGQLKRCIAEKVEAKRDILEDIERVQMLIEATPTCFVGSQDFPLKDRDKASGALTNEQFFEFLKEDKI